MQADLTPEQLGAVERIRKVREATTNMLYSHLPLVSQKHYPEFAADLDLLLSLANRPAHDLQGAKVGVGEEWADFRPHLGVLPNAPEDVRLEPSIRKLLENYYWQHGLPNPDHLAQRYIRALTSARIEEKSE